MSLQRIMKSLFELRKKTRFKYKYRSVHGYEWFQLIEENNRVFSLCLLIYMCILNDTADAPNLKLKDFFKSRRGGL